LRGPHQDLSVLTPALGCGSAECGEQDQGQHGEWDTRVAFQLVPLSPRSRCLRRAGG